MTIWGLRLTFNFWRRGGYGNLISHEEDYRWPILRKKMHPLVFLLFNLTFIATYQNVLLWLIALPSYAVVSSSPHILTITDAGLAVLVVVLIMLETVADQQHYDFQEYKHSLTPEQRQRDPRPSIRDGFFQEGLWRYSRHPNYFAEQSIWIVFYIFAATAHTTWLHWSGLGALLLVLLFQGSMAFGESITKSKYPSYGQYQKNVSQCIPFFSSLKDKPE